jgi:hypothetical protein
MLSCHVLLVAPFIHSKFTVIWPWTFGVGSAAGVFCQLSRRWKSNTRSLTASVLAYVWQSHGAPVYGFKHPPHLSYSPNNNLYTMTIGGAKPVLVQTALVGGPAVPFDDAKTVALWPAKLNIAQDHPITQIVVRSGWIIDNLTVTYKLINNSTQSVSHGGTGGGVHTIILGLHEIVSSIQGKAGIHSFYHRPYLCSVSFTILDTVTLATRTTEIFGNGDHTNQGDPFQVAQPYALAGDTYTDGQTGVAGLSLFKVLTNV